MRHTPTLLITFGIPIYVVLAFASTAVAPFWEELIGNTDTEVVELPRPITLTFVGDMMFDRFIREKAVQHGYPAILAKSAPLFASSTYLFGNLEGPVTTFTPVSDYRDGGPNHYRFTFATTVVATLHDAGFSAVTLGNNHVTNFGDEGLAQTQQWLDAFGIGYVGAPDDPYTPWRTATSGRDIAVYGYSPWHSRDVNALLTHIQAEATSTVVVVLAHWGEEYDTIPNTPERELAHRMVDAGADFIAGSHPHVIQSKELYHDRWIYYSLGNFVFDQYFTKQVRCGAVVSLTLTPEGEATTTEAFISLLEDGTTAGGDCMVSIPSLSS